MLDGGINDRIATGFWLLAGVAASIWFDARRRVALRLLREAKASATSSQGIYPRIAIDAFGAAGAWVLLFLVLDWLF
jgi:hypothetical protein